MIDKNQAVINFLLACPQLRDNPLFFNAIEATDNDKQIVTQSTDEALNKKFVDGSVMRRFTFSIIDFRSVIYQPLPKVEGYTSENVEEMLDVQGIMDWINEQADNQTFPNFGISCQVDSMKTTSDTPNLNGIDTNVSPALAKYSMSIQIDYIDTSKAVWNS